MPSIQCRLWRIQNSSDLALPPQPHPNSDPSTPDFHPDPSSPSDYPFPPPGLSRPSAMPYSPLDLELSPDALSTPSTSLPPESSDSSIWGAFKLDSFIANYCHNAKPVSSLSFHSSHSGDSSPNSNLLPSSTIPASVSPSICPAYLKRLKSLISHENGNTAPTRPVPRCPPPPPPVNPLVTLRLRQQAFMLKWNKFREKNPYAPVMPSYFNPSRSEAPQCTWTFLRDPASAGFVNEQTNARRGKETIFERPLVKLPLTRCRSICDGSRRVQHYDGWGIHAWISPSRHCSACANDTLFKNFLAFRAFEAARIQEVQQFQEQLAMISSPSSNDSQEEAPDPDAVLLSFPYQRSAEGQHAMDPFINYNDLNSCPSLSDRSVDWNDDGDKELFVMHDLDDLDLDSLEDDDGLWHSDEEDDDDRYSDSSSSDTFENDELSVPVCPTTVTTSSESDFKDDEKKTEIISGGIVLMTLHSDDGDIDDDIELVESQNEEADWARVVEVQVQA